MPAAFLTRTEVRELDRRAAEENGLPGLVLMENAGRGAADVLVAQGIHGRVAVCCGKGNNGGDGFVVARHLANRGIHVRVLLGCRSEELSGDAASNWQALAKSGARLVHLAGAERSAWDAELAEVEWIVDALFGTGLAGPVRTPWDQIIDSMNARAARVFAIDIPSGLDCDTGRPMRPTVKARDTATFVAPKAGFQNTAAAEWLGRVHVVDIGIPKELLE
jgi:NAD(P)H-hydrate epimerase